MHKADNGAKRWLKSNQFKVVSIAILIAAFLYRLYLCFQLPQGSDLLWHLGFSSHAFADNFSFYQLTSDNFQQEFWSTLWPGLPYIYPPVMLVFFFIFAKFNLGVFWIKLTLTLVESATAYFFYNVSKISALLFFCAPISLWDVSLKGQNDGLQSFFVALNALTVQRKNWLLAGFLFALSIQTKLFGLLLLPWLADELWSDRENKSFVKVLIGFTLGFIPFLGFYLKTPGLLLLSIQTVEADEINSVTANSINPFEWTPWSTEGLPIRFPYVSSSLTYILLIVLAGFIIFFLKKHKVRDAISLTPLTSFIFILKSLSVGRLWYALMIPGFTFCFSRKILIVNLVLILCFVLGGRALFSLIGDPGGHMRLASEEGPVQQIYQSCMFACDIQSFSTREMDL